MIISIRTLTLILLASFLNAFCFAQTERFNIYLSPKGSDINSGAIDSPLLTLEKAKNKILELKSSTGISNKGINVIFREGSYRIDSVFTLTYEYSGTEEAPLVFRAFDNERVIITSGIELKGWRPVSKNEKNVNSKYRDKIYCADIKKGCKFHFLYLNDKAQKLSRSDNSEFWAEWKKPVETGNAGKDGQLLRFPNGELDGLEGSDGDIEIDLFPVNYWNSISVLRGIDSKKSIAFRHSKNPATFWSNSFQEGNYNLLNSIKFIDSPGEWAVNTQTGKVYLYPESGSISKNDVIIAPTLYRLIHIKGNEPDNKLAKHICFEGLEFRYTDRMPEDIWPDEWIKRQAELPDAMIYIEDAEDIKIKNCKFFHSGSYGVDLEKYAKRIEISNNEMGYMGCGGVLLQGYGPGLKDVNKNNIIKNNYIHHTGMGGYLHSAAITLYQSGSNEIFNNVIINVPYVGIQICGANWDAYGQKELSQYPDPEDPGAIDSYGKAKAQYYTRWQDFPDGKESKFTRGNFKQYLHTNNNKIHHNMIAEYMTKLSDGAPISAWSTGMGNMFYKNLMKRSNIKIPGQKWLFALYMDDNVDGALLSDNVVWGEVVTEESSPGFRAIVKNNIWGQPYEENIFYNKGLNLWSGNEQSFPASPSGYDKLLKEIINFSNNSGGWNGISCDEVKNYFDKNDK